MLSAISYAFRDLDTLAAAEAVAASGFKHIELWRGHRDGLAEAPSNADPTGSAQQLRQKLEARGVSVSTYCVGGITDESPDQLERWARFALDLGTDILTGCLLRPDRAEEIDRILNRTGVRYAIENHKGIHFEGIEPYQSLFAGNRYPNLGINVDTGHFILADIEPADAIMQLGPRVFHVHLKDVPPDGHPRYEHSCPIGQGRLDVPSVLAALTAIGYTGPISVEYEDKEPLTALKSSVEYLSELHPQRKGA